MKVQWVCFLWVLSEDHAEVSPECPLEFHHKWWATGCEELHWPGAIKCLIPRLMVGHGRWPSWHWPPGEWGGGEGGHPWKVHGVGRLADGNLQARLCHYRTYWAESDGLVAQRKIIWFPVSPATKEEQGVAGSLMQCLSPQRRRWLTNWGRSGHWDFRGLRAWPVWNPTSPPKTPDFSQVSHNCDKSLKERGEYLELGNWCLAAEHRAYSSGKDFPVHPSTWEPEWFWSGPDTSLSSGLLT